MSIITKLSQDVTQYYKNITSPIGANTEYKKIYNYEQYKRCSRVTKRKIREFSKGPERKGLWTVCRWFTLPLRISDQQPDQQPGESTNFKLYDLDMQIQESQKLPNEWCDECQVACRNKHTCIDKSESKECVENRVVSIHTRTWMRHQMMWHTDVTKPTVWTQ